MIKWQRAQTTRARPGRTHARALVTAGSGCAMAFLLAALPTPPVNAASPLVATGSGGSWPGFRGGDRQGIDAAGGVPESWSVESGKNIAWTAEIPGLGHSSPVVSDGRVFVTTVYPSREARHLQDASVAVSIALTAVFLTSMLAWAHGISPVSRSFDADGGLVGRLGRGSFSLASAILAAAICLYGAHAFDYDRCPIRSWLGSMLFTGLMLSAMGSVASTRKTTSGLLLAIGLAMPVVTFVAIPAKDHVYRNGPLGDQVLTVVAVSLVPLLSVAVVLLGATAARASLPRPSASGRRIAAAMTIGLCLLGSVVAFRLHVAESSWASWGEARTLVPRPFVPIGPTAAAAGTSFLVALWAIVRLRAHPSPPRPGSATIFMLSAAVFVVSMLILGFTWAIRGSPFLEYHLPAPDWNPVLRPGAAGVLGALAATASCWLALRAFRAHLRLPATIAVASGIILGAVHMYAVNVKWQDHDTRYVRSVRALDFGTGRALWSWEGFPGSLENVHRENTQATPTIVAEGGRVHAFFGNAGLACLRADTGTLLWERHDLQATSIYGVGNSPVVAAASLCIIVDESAAGRACAIDCQLGTILWDRTRGPAEPGLTVPSGHSRTPCVVDASGDTQLLAWGWNELTAYDPRSGEISWSMSVRGGGDHVASVITDGRLIYVASPRGITAYPIGSQAAPPLAEVWHTKATINCSTPVSDGERVFAVGDRGVVTAVDARSGTLAWRERLEGEFRASPIIAGDRLYIGDLSGRLHIGSTKGASPRFETRDMGSPIFATVAAVDSSLLVRTEKTLCRIASTAPMGSTADLDEAGKSPSRR